MSVSGGGGGAGAAVQQAPFAPTHVVVLSEMSVQLKQKYYDVLIQSDSKFHREDAEDGGGGNYVANVRVLAPGVTLPSATAAGGRGAVLGGDAGSTSGHGGRGANTVSVEERIRLASMVQGCVQVEFREGEPFEHTAYPRFVNLIACEGDVVKLRTRPLAWLMRQVEEVYDARYIHDTADLQNDMDPGAEGASGVAGGGGGGGGGGPDGSMPGGGLDKESMTFPVFVVKHFSTRVGLRALVDQTCWDVLYNTHGHRRDFLEVEIFARFLQEFYDPDDLLFFLYVRSVIQKVLNVSFKARWTKPDKRQGNSPQSLWMSYRECVSVARTVFGSDQDPMCKEFLSMVESQVVGQRKNGKDTRRIEVSQFMHLAVVGYHETRPEDDELGAAPGADAVGGPSQGLTLSSAAPGGAPIEGMVATIPTHQAHQQQQMLPQQQQMGMGGMDPTGMGGGMDASMMGMYGPQGMAAGGMYGQQGMAGGMDPATAAAMGVPGVYGMQDPNMYAAAGGMLDPTGTAGDPTGAAAAAAATAAANGEAGGLDSYLENIARERNAIEEMERQFRQSLGFSGEGGGADGAAAGGAGGAGGGAAPLSSYVGYMPADNQAASSGADGAGATGSDLGGPGDDAGKAGDGPADSVGADASRANSAQVVSQQPFGGASGAGPGAEGTQGSRPPSGRSAAGGDGSAPVDAAGLEAIAAGAESRYLDELMAGVTMLPPQFASEIRDEVQQQLHTSVMTLLQQQPELQSQMNQSQANAVVGRVIQLPELRQEIEPLFALYVRYVTDRLSQSDGSSGAAPGTG